MRFANPEYLYLLALIIPYIIWYILHYRKAHPVMIVSTSSSFRMAATPWRAYLMHLPFLLRIACYALVVVALARPQTFREESTKRSIEGIDIMLCMDISGSMLAMDLEPNRVEAARQVAINFVSGRPNDNIGLTLFAGEAFTQCPMTVDHKVLLNMLNEMNTNLVEEQRIDDGTAIGTGLVSSINRLKESKAKSKTIILLTDGSNNCGSMSPSLAADMAREFGIRVYTIAVGTNGTAPFPYVVAGMRQTINIPVEIDTETLKDIADKTGGAFFRAHDNESLEQVYNEIDQLERSKIREATVYTVPIDHFERYLLLAVAFMGLEILLRNTLLRRLP